jgi:2,4-dienoyl-CoA reductase-like NADH-dependent reductase (Old Yellow Enzyme family)
MPRILDPLKTGSLELKNRIVMPPMGTGFSNRKGEVTEKHLRHYSERAKDLGLLIVEHSFVSHRGRASLSQLGAHSDDLVPGLTRLVDEVHKTETPIALQINHGGGTTSKEFTGSSPVAPSSVIHPLMGKEMPQQLSVDEIEGLIDDFKDAAQRAAIAGFDAVEVHCAHGYLLSQFLSPLTNKRKDSFGGTLENRARFPCRILEEIKKELGSNFPVLYRIGVYDLLPGGLTLQDGVEISKMLAEKGVIIMDVSGGIYDEPDGLEGPGYFVPHAAAVKEVVDIPVIGVGGIKTAYEADEVIRSGRVDLVAVGTAILEDPKWATRAVNKLRSNKIL